ncbi:hypothetical protein CPB84DRAFT_1767428 [Gymnopilus junonius]|uniref:Uncharacterized protein n=1 Tax=Gymnopilus junonius TaxID=109634 RepID=A0A9P5TSS3_GYMJU|nr:hypothetical protein CPB84DRAFT_1767428 [Gymnopilus junonius]
MMEFSFNRPRSATPSLSSTSTSASSSTPLSHLASGIFTPLTFDEEDESFADSERLKGAGMEPNYDFVMWQSSQTACQALNELIDTSRQDSESLRIRNAWQREPSFDQIPGFSLLSTDDIPPSSALESPLLAPKSKYKSSISPSTSSGPSSRPSSRTRLSETRPRPSSSTARSKDITSLPLQALPFQTLDKANPEKFLHIIKDAAKRADENAGALARARARKSTSSTNVMGETSLSGVAATAQKRNRVQSLESSSSESMKETKRKKGRTEMEDAKVDDKGKRREDEKNPPNASSFLPVADPKEHGVKQEDVHQRSSLPLSSRSNAAQSTRTPKLHPLLLQQPAAQAGTPSLHSTSAKPSSSRTSTTANTASYPKLPGPTSKLSQPQVQTQHKAYPVRPSSGSHHHANAQTTRTIASTSTFANLLRQPSPVPALQAMQAPNPTSTPSSSYTSRPPPLGMRRTHTYPSSIQTGELPKKQKGFKPPLLSASQPQAQSQSSQMHSRVPIEKGSDAGTTVTSGVSGIAKQQPGHSFHLRPPNFCIIHSPLFLSYNVGATSSNSATSHAYSSSSSKNSNLPQNKPSTASSHTTMTISAQRQQPAPSKFAPAPQAVTPAASSIPQHHPRLPVPQAPRPAPAPARPASPPLPPESLPEPADGDPDSSFGDVDMPFDMDALEETMKQYD